jgi:hypothetical protein
MKKEFEKKGCVYFFRHTGLTPVKIGYSSHESPLDRFNSFSTYAPYGSEIIGFIITENARDLESKFHKKYSNLRLNGEWFDITKEIAIEEIRIHSAIEDIQEMNEFQIRWAKQKMKHINSNFTEDGLYDYLFDSISLNVITKNKSLSNEFKSALGYEINIKTIKSELYKYCDKRKISIIENNSNGQRGFILVPIKTKQP